MSTASEDQLLMLVLVSSGQVRQRRTLDGWETRLPPEHRGKKSRHLLRVLWRRGWVASEGTGKPHINRLVLTDAGRAVLLGGS